MAKPSKELILKAADQAFIAHVVTLFKVLVTSPELELNDAIARYRKGYDRASRAYDAITKEAEEQTEGE